jgi:small subunit ribosomal protein S16
MRRFAVRNASPGRGEISLGGLLLKIRLARAGARKKASYRVVIIQAEKARDGRFVEIVGSYNPRSHPPEVSLNHERIAHWIGAGAQPSETVKSLLKRWPREKAAS